MKVPKLIDWNAVADILLRSLRYSLTVEEMRVITEAHLADAKRYAKLHEKIIAPHLAAS